MVLTVASVDTLPNCAYSLYFRDKSYFNTLGCLFLNNVIICCPEVMETIKCIDTRVNREFYCCSKFKSHLFSSDREIFLIFFLSPNFEKAKFKFYCGRPITREKKIIYIMYRHLLMSLIACFLHKYTFVQM